MWQDFALAVIGFVFTLMLIPQLVDGKRGIAILNFWTCLVTGMGCIIMGGVYLTLGLMLTTAISFSTGAMWLLLLYYSEENRKRGGIPVKYETPGARDLPIRDQGERNTSVAMSCATAVDLMKTRRDDGTL